MDNQINAKFSHLLSFLTYEGLYIWIGKGEKQL